MSHYGNCQVFSDLMQSPMIVPVKRLRDHMINQAVDDGVWAASWNHSSNQLLGGKEVIANRYVLIGLYKDT